jgi:cytochrome c556
MDMRSFVIGAALTGMLGIGFAFAQGNPIEQRQKLMKGNNESVKLVTAMIKGEKPYNAKAAATAMLSIKESATKFTTLFPVGTETGNKTRALPAIWKNKKDFEDWGKQLEEDAGKAQTAAAGGLDSMKPAIEAMGKTCGGCHDDYRAKQQ